MTKIVASKNVPAVISFKSPKAFEAWLSKNHTREEGIWLRFFKKDSEVKSITYAESVQSALCYGWIDGQSDKYDATSWIQKFTPRRKKSIWSKRNIEFTEDLIKNGRMKTPGLEQIEAAKADGRWEVAYDSPSQMQMPDYFMSALEKNKKAKTFFDTLNKANKYAIGWRLQTSKKEETKIRRMKIIIEMLKKNEKFH